MGRQFLSWGELLTLAQALSTSVMMMAEAAKHVRGLVVRRKPANLAIVWFQNADRG